MSLTPRHLTLAFLVLGVALRLVQYVAGGGQWLDEIAVSRNILERPLSELLTRPLAWDQSAPKGFLLAEKAATALLGGEDHALRLFPFLCSLLGLFAFWRVSERVLTGYGPAVAMALLGTAGALITYAGQVKQYSTDVAASVLLMWAVVDLVERGPSARRVGMAALAGAIGVWFLQPAVLMLAGLGLVLLVYWWRSPARTASVPLLLVVWAISAGAAAWASLAAVPPETREYLHAFWARSFPPVSGPLAPRLIWPYAALLRLFGGGGQASQNWPFAAVYIGLLVIGFWSLWRRQRWIGALVVAPIAVALAAAAARQYPFGDRVLLYLLPLFALAIGDAAEQLRAAVARRIGVWGALLPAAVLVGAVMPVALTRPPYVCEDVRPALEYLKEARRPGDAIYVYYGAGVGFTYYAERYGLRPEDFVQGGCHRGDSRRYLEELDALRGRPRVWFVVTHAIGYNERDDIFGYLKAIAVEREEARFVSPTRMVTFPFFPPVEVFLYDFSDPTRLGAADAASYKLTGPNKVHPAYGCVHGPQSMLRTAVRRAGSN